MYGSVMSTEAMIFLGGAAVQVAGMVLGYIFLIIRPKENHWLKLVIRIIAFILWIGFVFTWPAFVISLAGFIGTP
ncbi:hypothetical protein D0T11_03890 [Hymenobacter rubripertinctus]|uniref:Uncharacterized protein n=1 Tax=Hymenobacter rubripertinctus TaxID=2029981 RepID=A0A418R654_9BACT|nr:hypothetical protein D0T11_03890 [Hymenobacter rubripertinctus]